MATPNNPFEIVIQNKFYPNGITEENIFNYWKINKSKILDVVFGKEIFLYIASKKNEIVVRRYSDADTLYRLTPMNYEKIISSRTVGIVSTMNKSSDFGIVDIDVSPIEKIASNIEFETVKEATIDTNDFLSRFYKTKIFYTGKNGFHIHCKFLTTMSIDKIKDILKKQLMDSPLSKIYTILHKRDARTPNLDLAINKVRGGYITEGSINQIGIPCVNIKNSDELLKFKREQLVINYDNI